MPESGIEPEPLAPLSDALLLDHRDNLTYQLLSSYLTVST